MKRQYGLVLLLLSSPILSFFLRDSLRLGPAIAAEQKSTLKADWNRTLEAVKKEGQVNIYAVPADRKTPATPYIQKEVQYVYSQ